MKYLGFSLEDIKGRLVSLDTPADVAAALEKQADTLREKITSLSDVLQAVETFKTEVLNMQSVDFRKYADIVVSLKMKNESYWLIKHLDQETVDDLRSRFDTAGATEIVNSINSMRDKAIQYQKDGVKPDSDEGIELARVFWDKTIETTGGDMNLVSKLAEIVQEECENNVDLAKQVVANAFLEPALIAYFTKLGINPFEGIEVEQ
jgi:DNA-binding transcriptional MerR regulator